METVEKLEVKLAEFAKTHKHAIQHDPAFRARFLDMCAPLGVDPLSAEKGFWGGVLGIGEFYYELSVKVAEVCLASRSRNGGIIRWVLYDCVMCFCCKWNNWNGCFSILHYNTTSNPFLCAIIMCT